ncbi:MAG: FimB/Mfa2 family fimbrial subunit [Clostridium sp.]|nr:FimB/Mfa2 family fimbrial subunit [Clostridium sp.]
MIFFSNFKRYAMAAAAGLGLTASLSSCDSWIYNDEEDCVYYVRFEYDYNLKWANAFPAEVKSVTLYILDENDNVVLEQSENTSVLADNGYRMVIDDPKIVPGRYRLLAWAGDEEVGSYPKTTGTAKADHHRRLEREVLTANAPETGEAVEEHHHRGHMDRLYHGQLPSTLNTKLATNQAGVKDGYCIFSEGYRDVFTVPMMKDTNTIRIHLQQIGGQPMPVEKFDFTITDRNGHMDCENDICDDTQITYHPWALKSGTTDLTLQGVQATYGTALAEFTTSRLMKDNDADAILSIKNEEGEEIVRLPVLQALLLAKSEYYAEAESKGDVPSGQHQELSDQEFFDRQDTYNLTFFLDEHTRWTSAEIFIESWKVVWNKVDL